MESYMIHGLSFIYPQRTRPAISDISLAIAKGQFLTLCGPSGGGKTTLLRHLKPILAPHGEKTGSVLFEGAPIENLDQRTQIEKIGFVFQNVEDQLITDKVWHELAFGLESIGCPTEEIRIKVAEMAAFFGIEPWFYKKVANLSGGQKQILNLASIMVMQPSVLLLDEPTSQLDPIAAVEFLSTVGRINRELGVTVIMTEQRLEEVFPLSDRVVCLDEGAIICNEEPGRVGEALRRLRHGMLNGIPAPARIWTGVSIGNELLTMGTRCPVTVREGRDWYDELLDCNEDINQKVLNSEFALRNPALPKKTEESGSLMNKDTLPAIEMTDVWFRYEKDSPDVIKRLSLTVNKGEFLCVVGSNGAGKTTALMLAAGLCKPHRGKIRLFGEDVSGIPPNRMYGGNGDPGVIGVLPQNPQVLFVKKTVQEDLLDMLSGWKLSGEEKDKRLLNAIRVCDISDILSFHPYDLSGGEQQRAALAKVLLLRPRILLLDEPTKGLDAAFKLEFASILKELVSSGVTIVLVSHDIEFCAGHGDRCAMFFDGGVVSNAPTREFFSGNNFYTTAANRMVRHSLPGAVTAGDVIGVLGGAQPCEQSNREDTPLETNAVLSAITPKHPVRLGLPLWRKIIAAVAALLFVSSVALIAFNFHGFSAFISGGSEAERAMRDPTVWRYAGMLITLCVTVLLFAVMVNPVNAPPRLSRSLMDRRKLSKRTLIAMFLILVAIPLTIAMGVRFFGERRYYFISMLIILETMLPFVLIFEGRKPLAREIVIIAVLCALGVAGRTAFFMLPHVKPIAAIAIITGVAFGGESGFLCGAMAGFLSNMFFGQGAWTPWQMFAYGIIGFLAGVLFRNSIFSGNRTALSVYGGLAVFLIYGTIMNLSSVLMYQTNPTLTVFLAYMAQGIPFDLIHAASTAVFLAVLARPMLEKLDRIRVKYGILD